MQQVKRLAVIVMLLVVGRAGAQSIDVDATLPDGADAGGLGAVVQAAPGGGDMVLLGPESRYVTRAWRDHDGNMQCGCTREDAEVAERVRSGGSAEASPSGMADAAAGRSPNARRR